MKICLAQLNPIVGDLLGNTQKIIRAIREAKNEKADLILFSELILTGYPPEDFLLLHEFVKKTEAALQEIAPETKGISAVIGTLRTNNSHAGKPLFNSAAIFENGILLGYQDKSLLPTYDVFDERRYFEPAKSSIRLWELAGKKCAITICEDIWQHAGLKELPGYEKDPVDELKALHPDIAFNLSASPFHLGKLSTRASVASKAAKTLNCPLALCNQVGGNDSLIFDGHSLLMSPQGKIVHVSKGFEEDLEIVNSESSTLKSLPEDEMEQLHAALVLGLKDYFGKMGFKKACLGLSGGIDSALVACLAQEALGPENVLAVAMPSRFSSKSSLEDASILAKNLAIRFQVIPIEGPFEAYLDLLTPYFEGKPFDTTEENLQARIRSMILMSLSNKHGYIVLSTGNKSELAMGYSTLYGDMSGGLSVISDLTKEQVYSLSRWINRSKEVIPENTLVKPPSAELKPNQKDSDTLPPYETLDTVLKDYIEKGRSPEEISQAHTIPLSLVQDLIRRIHQNEYKRRQAPPGLRVSEKAFSIGRRFPIIQKWA